MLAEQTRRLYEQTVRAMPFGIIAGGMVVAAIELSRGSLDLLWFWGMLAIVAYARTAHAQRVVAQADWRRDTRRLIRAFALGTAIEGLMWGLAFVFIAHSGSVWTQAFMLSAMAGIAVGNLATTAAIRVIYPVGLVAMFTPVLLSLGLDATVQSGAMAAMLAMFLLNLYMAFSRCHEAIRAEIGLHAERANAHRALETAHARIARLSLTDALTAVPNRRRFEQQLAEEWARAIREDRPLALAMVDIDRFKPLNDAAGHLAGDECLRRVARALTDVVQRPGDLVARYGGEEFAVLLPNADVEGARTVGEEIRWAIERLGIAHPHPSCHGPVTVSVGVASLRPSETNEGPSRLIDAADRALYAAKHLGRNRVEAASSSVLRAAS